ncbi:MAG: hypothetical protein NVSMB26_03610 [Beijerinckiaceae bacterium]
MTNLDPLILDFLEWVGADPRPYAEVMDAWRTSCPRLTIWEDSIDRGLVARETAAGCGLMIKITQAGRDFLRDNGRAAAALEARWLACDTKKSTWLG